MSKFRTPSIPETRIYVEVTTSENLRPQVTLLMQGLNLFIEEKLGIKVHLEEVTTAIKGSNGLAISTQTHRYFHESDEDLQRAKHNNPT